MGRWFACGCNFVHAGRRFVVVIVAKINKRGIEPEYHKPSTVYRQCQFCSVWRHSKVGHFTNDVAPIGHIVSHENIDIRLSLKILEQHRR